MAFHVEHARSLDKSSREKVQELIRILKADHDRIRELRDSLKT